MGSLDDEVIEICYLVVSLVLRHLVLTRFRKWCAWLQGAISRQNFRSEKGHGANWMTLPVIWVVSGNLYEFMKAWNNVMLDKF